MNTLLKKVFSIPTTNEDNFILDNYVCKKPTDEGLLIFAQTIHALLDNIEKENNVTPNNGIHSDTKHDGDFAKFID